MSMNVFGVSYVFITLFIIYYVYCRFCIQYSSLYSVLQNDNNASFAMFLYCFANYSGWSHTAAPLPRVLLLYCSLQLHCPQGFAGYSGLCPANPGQRFRGLFGIVSSKPGAAVSRDIRDCVQQTRGSGFAGIQGLFPANPGLRDHLESSRIFTQICGLFRILSRSSWDIRFLLFSHIGLI